jgi:hypothetical protein
MWFLVTELFAVIFSSNTSKNRCTCKRIHQFTNTRNLILYLDIRLLCNANIGETFIGCVGNEHKHRLKPNLDLCTQTVVFKLINLPLTVVYTHKRRHISFHKETPE